MHGLHDLTGNDVKSLKGESLISFRTINTMKELTLYCDLLLCGSPSLFSYILFFFFIIIIIIIIWMRRIITKTDVHSMTHTSPTMHIITYPPPRPQTLSLFHPYLIIPLSGTQTEIKFT